MNPIITENIPEQAFEVVMYQIAAILFIELGNQRAEYDNIGEFAVFADRMTPYDKGENIVLNVSIATGNYGNHQESSVEGKITYHIEIYTVNEPSKIPAGDAKRYALHRIAGLVRYILQSHKYFRLGFGPGIIASTLVESLQFFDDYNNNDGANTRVCTVSFSAKVQEEQNVFTGRIIDGNDSEIRLEETDKGYKITQNN